MRTHPSIKGPHSIEIWAAGLVLHNTEETEVQLMWVCMRAHHTSSSTYLVFWVRCAPLVDLLERFSQSRLGCRRLNYAQERHG